MWEKVENSDTVRYELIYSFHYCIVNGPYVLKMCRIDGVQHYIGVFDTQEEAASEYQIASMKFGRNSTVTSHKNTDDLIGISQGEQMLQKLDISYIPTKILEALKLKLQLGKVTLQLHCEQLGIHEGMTQVDRNSDSYSTEVSQELIASRLNAIRTLQEDQVNLSYQLFNLDLSQLDSTSLERFGLDSLLLQMNVSQHSPSLHDDAQRCHS